MNKMKDICLNIVRTVRFLLVLLLRTDLKNHVPVTNADCSLYVLANGPSLKENLENIDFSKGHFAVVNYFYKSPYYRIIKPQYYILADPFFFTKIENIIPFVESVDWKMKLFVPFSAWDRLDALKRLPNAFVSVIPYHTTNYQGFPLFRKFAFRRGLAMPSPQNVLIPCIFNGINMGYKEIRLFGVDHSWTTSLRVNSKNEVCLTDSHFYDDIESHLKPWLNCSGEPYKMHEVLRDLALMFDSYHMIRDYADYRGCKIFNCTKDSFIDAFERKIN